MSVNNFSTDLWVVSINGRIISDWGEASPPYTDDPIDQKSQLRRGQGGNAVRLDRINPGRTVNLNLNPGSSDSAFMQGLFNSNASITLTTTQIGTLEGSVGAEGVIINDGQMGRGGDSVTDDIYIMEFNTWSALKGGSV